MWIGKRLLALVDWYGRAQVVAELGGIFVSGVAGFTIGGLFLAILAGIGTGLALLLIFTVWNIRRSKLPPPTAEVPAASQQLGVVVEIPGAKLPMRDAALIAQDALSEQFYRNALAYNKDDPLRYYAHFLTDRGATPLFGARFGSGVRRQLPIPADESQQWAFEDSGSVLRHRHNKELVYQDIHIRRADVDRVIGVLKGAQ